MRVTKQISLPFWESIKRSFLYTLYNGSLLGKMLAFGIILIVFELLTGFETLKSFSSDGNGIDTDWRSSVGNLLNALVSLAVMINYCRFVILKAPLDFGSLAFFKRLSLLFFVLVVFTFIMVVPLVATSLLVRASSVAYLLGLLLLLTVAILLSPIFLYFVAIAVDNKNISIKEAFKISKGNYNKIFWGSVLIMLPCTIITVLVSTIYTLYLPDAYFLKLIFSIIFVALSIFDTCFKASFFAHIYQYFTFYKKEKL